MPRQAINPDTLFNSTQYGFSQITIGQGSRMISVSGQVAWDSKQNIIGDDLPAQTLTALSNLEQALIAVGGTLDDILSLRIYIKQSVIDETKGVADGLLRFFPNSPPTATWIGVPALARPEFLIEIEAIAILA